MYEWYLRSKGVIGSIVLILTGIYLLLIGHENEGLAAIGLGLSLLGIRHKLERIKKG